MGYALVPGAAPKNIETMPGRSETFRTSAGIAGDLLAITFLKQPLLPRLAWRLRQVLYLQTVIVVAILAT
jgi:hypothetical protein